jgi:hypothetical protein
VGTGQGEYTPEHVHHNYKYSRKSSLFIISWNLHIFLKLRKLDFLSCFI